MISAIFFNRLNHFITIFTLVKYISIIINSSLSGTIDLQIGIENTAANDRISITQINAISSGLAVGSAQVAVSTQAAAQAALTTIDTAISNLATRRGELGAIESRLSATVANLQNTVEKNSAAESTIRDVDIARKIAVMVRNQILQQASVAMLAQANQIPGLALTLLR